MIKYIEKANKFMKSKQMAAIDWAISGLIIAYGLYSVYSDGLNTTNGLTLGCGVLGLVLAYLKPAVKIQNYLESRLVRRIKNNE